jgi:hypothetical protein
MQIMLSMLSVFRVKANPIRVYRVKVNLTRVNTG